MKPTFDRIRLRELRREKGWKQIELAGKVGCSNDHLSRIENGGTRPSRKLAARMAEALGVDVDSLYVTPEPEGMLRTENGDEAELLDAYRRLSEQYADYVLALTLGLAKDANLDAASAAAEGYMTVRETRRAAGATEGTPPRPRGKGGRRA